MNWTLYNLSPACFPDSGKLHFIQVCSVVFIRKAHLSLVQNLSLGACITSDCLSLSAFLDRHKYSHIFLCGGSAVVEK